MAGIGLERGAAIDARLERRGERRQRRFLGPLRAGRRHHAGAQLANHLLGDVGVIVGLGGVERRERQPPALPRSLWQAADRLTTCVCASTVMPCPVPTGDAPAWRGR